jgi:hypothetical protein
MVQIDIPIVFGLGALFADAARDHLRAPSATPRDEAFYRALASNLVFVVLFVSWLPLYLLVTRFGFETSHMWWHRDAVADYHLFVPIFVVVFFLADLAGFALGVRLVRAGRIGLNRAVVAATAVFSTAWVFLQPHRTLVVGTYDEWRAGQAMPVSSDRQLLAVLAVSAIVFGVGLVVSYRWLRRAERGAVPA